MNDAKETKEKDKTIIMNKVNEEPKQPYQIPPL